MKKLVFTFFLLIFLFNVNSISSQNPDVGDLVKTINSLLKENPYIDDFQEITFYYSVDVTPENEFVVNLEFDGPFKTLFRSKFSDLNPAVQNNPTMLPSTHLCWNCKSIDSKEGNSCVYNETIYEGGDKEVHTSANICVMFSNQKGVYNKLRKAFDQLFSECTGKK